MKLNLPNKLTIFRICLTFLIVIILLFPFYNLNFEFFKIIINNKIIIDTKYIISGILFIIASVTDFFDGHIARKNNLVTDLGKMLDAIADKILVNSVLIILATQGFIPAIIPVIIIMRDTIVDTIKMVVGSKSKVVAASFLGKLKTAFMMVGVSLTLFYNLPFELWSINISSILLLIATILSIVSGIQYFVVNKNILLENDIQEIK